MEKTSNSDPFLRLIAGFKLMKSALFLAVGIGLLHLFDKDVELRLEYVLGYLHVDSDNHYAQGFLAMVDRMTNTNLKLAGLGAISLFYACLFGVEGVGLLLHKRWAEWMVVIVTGSLLPLEVYELFHKPNAAKIILTAVNLLILTYLVIVIRRKQLAAG